MIVNDTRSGAMEINGLEPETNRLFKAAMALQSFVAVRKRSAANAADIAIGAATERGADAG
jgi:hypothetical protein